MIWSPISAPILVGGAPRTATSWTAKVLSFGSFVSYVREPLLQGQPEGYTEDLANLYLRPDEEHPLLERVWRRALGLRTRLTKRWLYSETKPVLRRAPFVPTRLLVKEVVCTPSLAWLQSKVGFQIVVPLRHPCGFLASSLRLTKLGHSTLNLEALVRQKPLMTDYFVDCDDTISAARTPDERVLLAYCMLLRIVEQEALRHPDWIVVRHEDLCKDPLGSFAAMFARLGMTFTADAIKFVERSTGADDGQTYGVFRNSAHTAGSWKDDLPAHLVKRASETCRALRIRSY
jgi:hypothetical protein